MAEAATHIDMDGRKLQNNTLLAESPFHALQNEGTVAFKGGL